MLQGIDRNPNPVRKADSIIFNSPLSTVNYKILWFFLDLQ